jgi:hypothetical protein
MSLSLGSHLGEGRVIGARYVGCVTAASLTRVTCGAEYLVLFADTQPPLPLSELPTQPDVETWPSTKPSSGDKLRKRFEVLRMISHQPLWSPTQWTD